VVAALPEIAAPAEEVDAAEVRTLVESLRFKLQRPDKEWDPARRPDAGALQRVREALARADDTLEAADADRARAGLVRLQQETFADFGTQIDFMKRNTVAAPISLDTLPVFLRERFVGVTGKYLVQVFPARNVWDPAALAEFVTALRRVDPQVTGGPVTFFETSRLMRDGYFQAGAYALVAICILVVSDFRRLSLAFLALVPLAVGALWTVGVMGLLGLQFNLANLIILPLIIGIGISNGIHIMHRHLEEGHEGPSVIARSTGKAVVLSSLTTAVGFGSLMVARHYGIFSLGLLLTVGVVCNLLASITALPAILALRSPLRPAREAGVQPRARQSGLQPKPSAPAPTRRARR
jgi:hypothetical protein